SSSSCSCSASNNSTRRCELIALRFSGRLSVMRRTPSAGSSTRMHSNVRCCVTGSRLPRTGELGQQLERTRLVGSHDQRRGPGRLPRCVPLANPLLRAEQSAVVEELVG